MLNPTYEILDYIACEIGLYLQTMVYDTHMTIVTIIFMGFKNQIITFGGPTLYEYEWIRSPLEAQ